MMHTATLLALLLSGCAAWSSAQALQVTQLHTEFQDGEYRLTMTATLAAPLARVRTVLRDYEHYPELDVRILQARILGRPQLNQLQLLTRIRLCIAFICRTVQRVEQVDEQVDGLQAQVLPAQSDAERGSTLMHLEGDDGQTRVSYQTRIVPKFWVPAWLGRAAMLRDMQAATVTLFTRIEQRASLAP
jgi:hypothetical protein